MRDVICINSDDGRHYTELAPDAVGIAVAIFNIGGKVDGTDRRMAKVVHRDRLTAGAPDKISAAIRNILAQL